MITVKDSLGTLNIDENRYYGPFTARALENFNVSDQTVSKELIYAYVLIKKCAAITNQQLGYLSVEKSRAIIQACDDILDQKYDQEFVVNKYQGGAGTSTNMNVNEVISNIALEYMNHKKHQYEYCHPIDDVNLHQSTNDTYPTALKIACIRLVRELADEYSKLQESFQDKESTNRHILKLGRTQMMDAVPILASQMFSAYADVTSRDRWRIYKVEERLRYVNIGGTAIGTGINAPLKFGFKLLNTLQQKAQIGLARSDNLIDTTQNLDAFTETSSLLSVAATNLIKISQDLRFLSSGPNGGIGEITLEKRQDGSTIMPGKTNPVIVENTIQIAERVIANDQLIKHTVAMGNLELNAFMPIIAESLIESLTLLIKGVNRFREYVIESLVVNKDRCLENLKQSHSLITPLIEDVGYDKAACIVKEATTQNTSIQQILLQQNLYTKEELDTLLSNQQCTHPR